MVKSRSGAVVARWAHNPKVIGSSPVSATNYFKSNMYDIKLSYGEEYVDHYIYKSRNEFNQIIVCEVWRTFGEFLNFCFYITTKRKNGFQDGSITGKDGLKSFIWAKNCLIDFIEFGKMRFKGDNLVVNPANGRLRKIYERVLLPLGFKTSKSKDKYLYLKL